MIKTVLHRLRNGKHVPAADTGAPDLRTNRLRELVRTGQDLDLLLINVRDFPLLRELYGQELSLEVEAQLTAVRRQRAPARGALLHDP